VVFGVRDRSLSRCFRVIGRSTKARRCIQVLRQVDLRSAPVRLRRGSVEKPAKAIDDPLRPPFRCGCPFGRVLRSGIGGLLIPGRKSDDIAPTQSPPEEDAEGQRKEAEDPDEQEVRSALLRASVPGGDHPRRQHPAAAERTRSQPGRPRRGHRAFVDCGACGRTTALYSWDIPFVRNEISALAAIASV
jgi:hypothetical protein